MELFSSNPILPPILFPRYIDLGLWNPVAKILDPICKSCLELVVGSSFIADLNKGGYVEATFNHPSLLGGFFFLPFFSVTYSPEYPTLH